MCNEANCVQDNLYNYVLIRLHAVQFGNNWMKKILRSAKIGRDCKSEKFFEFNYFQIGQACSAIRF